ncbi:DUF4307 domain-containing protein [Kitasatospora sp. NBC_00240]|uniref:DUF4307 domain-containing protein n=1 Tax=Kitasatospora sp. NBC_00240 TaxID=2903567 RepID=UPI00225742E7|nr:DUF4307 domain-containing protein [Kitasatospora sp. NBC_00240]MCX5211054.1 DUF4307 domain-containing protein [Kitasatospora sp. NBC_00240]
MKVGTTTAQPPAGRYGRTGDREADRRLKAVGAACAVVLLGLVTWFGVSYLLRETAMNGLVPTFQAVSDSEMQIHLQVSKNNGTAGACTVRSQAADGTVVGQSDFPVPAAGSDYDAVLTLRTTARGTTAQLLGCTPAK